MTMQKLLLAILVLASGALTNLQAASPLLLTEFMAANSATLADEDGDYEDWIEIHNPGIAPVNLQNWSLTDSTNDLTRWRFPATNLNGGAYLVVFASGKNRRVPGARLHTNFKLGNSGEYLALVEPDGVTKASEFAPAFPPQVTDVSFGLGVARSDFTLLATNAPVRVRIPADDTLGLTWTAAAFDDGSWREGVNGVGYDTGVLEPAEDSFAASVTGAGPIAYWRFSEASGTVATNLGSLGAAANGAYLGGVSLNQAGPRPPALGGFESNNAAGQFNGTSARVQVPDVPAFDFGTGPYTIAMWFNPSNAAVRGDLFTYKASGNDYGIHVASQGANTISVYHNTFIGTAGTVASGQWYFFVVTREAGGRTTAWLNGVVLFTGNDSASMSIPMDLLIGSNHGGTPSSPSIPFNGLIDEVALYSRALSTNEIQQQYRVATGGGSSYTPLIATDVRNEMSGLNSSAYLRMPFVVTNVADVSQLILRLRYDDGFVAYINGVEATAANAPDVTTWDSAAIALHPDSAAVQFEEFNLTDARGALVAGTNVLSIHGLNVAAGNADFFIQAELKATTISTDFASPRYFTVPTPGAPNGAGTADLGPIITYVGFTPAPPLKPADSDDITVTARVDRAFSAVTNVVLRYRVNYGATNQLAMADDGAHGDGGAGDGIFGAIIPAAASTSGQMVRFAVTAQDALGRFSRWPLFEDPLNSPEYLGTVIANPAVTSAMPIWEWFAQSVANARTRTGSRGALWFNGEFYDNIFIRERGGFTTGGSQKFDFNTGDHVKINDEVGRVEEANLNANGSDSSFIRQPMAFEAFRLGENPASVSFHVLMRANGAADRVGIFIEQVDERFLERNGFDREGALYKFIQRASGEPVFSDSTDGVEKKTRLYENNADLQAFVVGLNQTNPVARRAWFFDNINVPNLLNYCALRSITQDADDVRKNFYWHRDTRGTKEWSTFPWDKDWTFGVVGDGGPGLTHPFFGDYVHRKPNGNQWNRLYEFVFNDPVTQPLMLRRLRTVMDQMLQPPGTPAASGLFEQRAIGWMSVVARELGVSNQISSVLNFFPPRRTDLYVTFAATNTQASVSNALVPLPTPVSALPSFGLIEANPASGNPAEEFIQLTNPTPFALDVSGWQLDGAVQFTFRPGTVIPGPGSLYLSPDVNAFRARATGPRGGQGLLVQGNYRGQLSARGETVRLIHREGWLVREVSYPGAPSLAQQYLRITELMYSPAAVAGDTNSAQELEFIELKNTSPDTTLDLNGVRFLNGIEFSFAGSAVTALAPGASVVVVKNPVAFAARYGTGLNVAGAYVGLLENGGERIQLVDASGEEILDFSYENAWYPITDGLGYSLVIVSESAEPDAWGRKSNWRAGGQLNGSPGAADPGPPAIVPVVISEALTRSDTPPPTDSIELFNPTGTPADIGGWFLTDDPGTPGKYRIPDNTVLPAGSYRVFDEADFNPGGTGFALGADGDEVYLISADRLGNLTGYLHGYRFGAAEDDVTFGRLITSDGQEHFVAQEQPTLGTNNAGPRVGPVIIQEIMYHPPEVNGSVDNTDDEFIELLNRSSHAVPLFETNWPVHAWTITGGVGFTFPTGVWLSPGESLLLVNFNPTNLALRERFRATYQVSASVQMFGPYSGKLNNDADDVELKKPTIFVGDTVGYVLVDKVDYRDSAPWPAGADGFGLSLQRIDPGAYGNDPANWTALSPTAAGAAAPMGAAPTLTGQPVSQTVLAFSPLTLAVSATGDDPLRYQWRRNGQDIAGETNAAFVMPSLLPAYAGDYRVVVYNRAGAAVSSNATITLLFPASIVSPPQGQAVFPRTNVTFRVTAWSDTPLTYQWRFNGHAIGDATNATYSITNVQPSDDGDYSVVVTDSVGPNVSAPARLTVFAHPVFTLQPTNRMVVVTNLSATVNVTMSAAAVSSTPVRYQWLFNGELVPNATNATQTFSNLTLSSSGDYAVVATDGYGSATSTNGTLLVALRAGLLEQPQSLTVLAGQDAVFACAANGTPPLAFRWRRNGSTITNGTPGFLVQTVGSNSTLTVTAASYLLDGDRYSVIVTNLAGSAPTSTNAVLRVLYPPLFLSEPTNLFVNAGATGAFRAVFQANPSGSYAWWFNQTNLLDSGTNSISQTRFTNSLTLSNVQADVEGLYTLVLSNEHGVAVSTGAVLALRRPPTIVTQPQSRTVPAGATATFSVGLAGTPPFSYAWKFNGTNLPGAIGTNATLSLTNVQPAQAGDYFVVVTNTLGAATSAVATLTVTVPPTLAGVGFDSGTGLMRFTVPTVPGTSYVIEYTEDLGAGTWQRLRTVPGDGSAVVIEDPVVQPAPSQRFYRVRLE